ncbi:hypothetical protein [Micromonospora sp. RP3T]|uniref:hypothetical protein n=1 Tax=Micromonospora sp. RP3T TaxID=2135446 RepID=UPI003D74F0E6
METDITARSLFTRSLKDLHAKAGAPSSRDVSLSTGAVVSHTTVAEALRGRTIPRWSAVEAIVLALKGDPESFRPLWVSAREERNEKAHTRNYIRRLQAPLKVALLASFAIIDNTASYDRVKRSLIDLGNGISSATGAEVEIIEANEKGSVRQTFRHRIRRGLGRQTLLICFISPSYLRNLHYREELRSLLISAASGDAQRTVLPVTLTGYQQLSVDFFDDPLWESLSPYPTIDWSELKSSDPGSGDWMKLIEAAVRRATEMLLTPPAIEQKHGEEESDLGAAAEEIDESLNLLVEGVRRIEPALSKFGELLLKMGEKTARLLKDPSPTRDGDLEDLRLLSLDHLQTANDLQETFEMLDDAITKIVRLERKFPGLSSAEFWDAIREIANEHSQFGELLKHVKKFEDLHNSTGSLSEIATNLHLGSYSLVDFRAMSITWLEELEEVRRAEIRRQLSS